MLDTLLSYAENSSGGTGMSSIWYIAAAVGLWKMFEKAGEPGWIGLIPFYRDYKICEKTIGDPWYWLRELIAIIPVIGWVAALYFKFQIGRAIARSYGKAETWAWGYTFLEPVFYCLTGFDDSSYYGVMGVGDSRTGEARQARTVDFDIVKNDAEVRIPPEEAKADEVEFDFEHSDVTD